MKRAEKSAEQLREQEKAQKLKEAGKGFQCSAKSRKENRRDTSSGKKGIKKQGKEREIQHSAERGRKGEAKLFGDSLNVTINDILCDYQLDVFHGG